MSNENELAVIQLFQGCLSKNIVISTNLRTNQNNTKNLNITKCYPCFIQLLGPSCLANRFSFSFLKSGSKMGSFWPLRLFFTSFKKVREWSMSKPAVTVFLLQHSSETDFFALIKIGRQEQTKFAKTAIVTL